MLTSLRMCGAEPNLRYAALLTLTKANAQNGYQDVLTDFIAFNVTVCERDSKDFSSLVLLA